MAMPITLSLVPPEGEPVRLAAFLDMVDGYRKLVHATENALRTDKGMKRLHRRREWYITSLEMPGKITIDLFPPPGGLDQNALHNASHALTKE